MNAVIFDVQQHYYLFTCLSIFGQLHSLMTRNHIVLLSLLFCLLAGLPTVNAQDSTAMAKTMQDTSAGKFPRVLLVQLSSEHNRLVYLQQKKRYKDLEIATNDAKNVSDRMILDFKDNFKYCKVYYYVDTNLDHIKQRDFDGVLLNADRTVATEIVINDTSKDYLIVYYGYPTEQSKEEDVVTDADRYRSNNGHPMGRGLIINNYLFQQVSFLYKFGYENVAIRSVKANRPYIYVSKKWEMEYFPFAALLNQHLNKLKLPITNYARETLKKLFLQNF